MASTILGSLPSTSRPPYISRPFSTPRPLSTLERLYIYAIHGFVSEVLFTAAWQVVVGVDWRLPGSTSVWSLPIYGVCTLVVERLYLALRGWLPLAARALLYTVWTYAWELSTGLALRQLGACPWDYSAFRGSLLAGLITLEYAPLWFVGGIVAERLVIARTLRLHWGGGCHGSHAAHTTRQPGGNSCHGDDSRNDDASVANGYDPRLKAA